MRPLAVLGAACLTVWWLTAKALAAANAWLSAANAWLSAAADGVGALVVAAAPWGAAVLGIVVAVVAATMIIDNRRRRRERETRRYRADPAPHNRPEIPLASVDPVRKHTGHKQYTQHHLKPPGVSGDLRG